jgi:hypothetical protein
MVMPLARGILHTLKGKTVIRLLLLFKTVAAKSLVENRLVTANIVINLDDAVTLRMEATRSSESSVLTRPTRRHIPEILCSNSRENLKSCRIFTGEGTNAN